MKTTLDILEEIEIHLPDDPKKDFVSDKLMRKATAEIKRMRKAVGAMKSILMSCARNADNRGTQRFILGELKQVEQTLEKR